MPVRKLNMFKQLRWSIRFSFIVFSLGYLILAMHLPVAIKIFATHDDALFWDHAQQIIKGNWLGSYNNLTLAKGVGFPLFLAMNAVLGIPVTLLLALFYLFACGLLAKTLIALKINKYYVLFIFVIILFHPALFPIQIIRDNIYPALSLIVISGVIRAILAPQPYDNTLRSVIPYGVALAWFWLTREEGIWMVPSIIVLLTLKLMQLKKQNLTFKPVLYRLCCLSVIAIALVNLVAGINYAYYGKFEAVDFTGSAYAKALKSLNSVDVGEDLPYIPVSFTKRQVIYKVSPSFNELYEFFDINKNRWKGLACGNYPWACEDYVGGWFDWALRDAVASQGYYDRPEHAEAFYKRITQEINGACEQGLIKCQAHFIPLMPNISNTQWKQFPSKVLATFNVARLKKPIKKPDKPADKKIVKESSEQSVQLDRVLQFLGYPRTFNALNETNTLVKMTLKIKATLYRAYQMIVPNFVILGLSVYFVYFALIVFKHQSITDIFMVSTMLWCLFLSRVVILVLVDISSFSAINSHYISAAFPIVCLAAFLSIQLVFVKKHH